MSLMSSKILNTKTKTFRFNDNYEMSNNNYCDIEITVKEKLYNNGNTYYYISYKNTYSDKCKASHCHPLSEKAYEKHMEGEIIIKNPLTEQLVKFLLMDFESLEKFSGNSMGEHYKGCIMRSICNFWD